MSESKSFRQKIGEYLLNTEQKEASVFAQLLQLTENWSIFGKNVSTDRLLAETYMMNVVAYRCIREIADNAATVEFELYSTRGKGKEIDNHPLLDLLLKPNPVQSGQTFWQNYHTNKQATGSAFIQKLVAGGTAKELYNLPTQQMKVVKADKGFVPKRYEYIPEPTAPTTVVPFPVEPDGDSDILWSHFYNPTNHWDGMAPLEAALMNVDTANLVTKWNAKLIQNDARPSGMLIAKANLAPDKRKELEKKFNDKYAGAANAGKPMFLSGDFDWKELGLSPKDMDFMNQKAAVARDLAMAFRIPPILLNIGSDTTYANMAEARLALWEETLIPELDNLIAELNNWLVPEFGDNLKLNYDKDKISALNDRRWKLYEIAGNADFLTKNEKREMVGFDPIEGGDEIAEPAPVAEPEEQEEAQANTNIQTKATKATKALVPTGPHAGHYHKFDADKQKGITTETKDHTHEYIVGAKYTSIVDGHRHELPVEEDE